MLLYVCCLLAIGVLSLFYLFYLLVLIDFVFLFCLVELFVVLLASLFCWRCGLTFAVGYLTVAVLILIGSLVFFWFRFAGWLRCYCVECA